MIGFYARAPEVFYSEWDVMLPPYRHLLPWGGRWLQWSRRYINHGESEAYDPHPIYTTWVINGRRVIQFIFSKGETKE